jgi:hypothetical protein
MSPTYSTGFDNDQTNKTSGDEELFLEKGSVAPPSPLGSSIIGTTSSIIGTTSVT